MRIICTNCRSEVSLDHEVFEDYQGPAKCFCCGTIMDIKVKSGILEAINAQDLLPKLSIDLVLEQSS
jgi:hypothetical protein